MYGLERTGKNLLAYVRMIDLFKEKIGMPSATALTA